MRNNQQNATAQTVLQVDGITCLDCAGKFEAAVRQMPGVVSASLNPMTGRLTLTGDQLDKLREMSAALKENYGVKVTILVSKGEIEWPKSGEAPLELFIAVAPEREEAVMSFSPLLRRGLDEEFCYKLQHEVLEAQVRGGQLFRALAESLTRLWQRLGSIS